MGDAVPPPDADPAAKSPLEGDPKLAGAGERTDSLAERPFDTLENISDAFYTLDHQWRFTYLNREAERILGRSRESLLNRVVWDEFPEASGSAFSENSRKTSNTGETSRFTAFYPPLNKWLGVSAYATAEGLAVYFRDLTEDRGRSEQLQLLESAVSRQSDILLITQADPIDVPEGPKIVYVNEAFVQRTGYSREEVIGKTPRILQGPKTERKELDRIRAALETWRPVRAELTNYAKDGREFSLELDIAPVRNGEGPPTHFVSVERDVTARRLAARELEEAQTVLAQSERAQRDLAAALSAETARLNFAQSVAGVGSWDLDLATRGVAWSRATYDIFGLSRTAFDGTLAGLLERVHPDDRDLVNDALARSLAGDADLSKVEHRIVTPGGLVKVVSERWKVLRDDDDRPAWITGTTQDISERVRLEEMLRQSQKLEAIGQLTGGVAHDFNNLLTIILANAELLSEHLSDDQHLRVLADMTATAAERGAALTHQLLSFARRQALEPKVVNINQCVADMDGLLRRAIPEDVDIEFVSSDGLWMTELDLTQLEASLLNLAVNSSHAMPNGGHLTIETANVVLDDGYAKARDEVEPGQYILVSVSDSGTGMTQSIVEKAFDPFFTTKEIGNGSGLGLSMVYGFVKQSKGHAIIYSEVGHGTTVKLYFPRVNSTAEPVRREERAGRIVGGQSTFSLSKMTIWFAKVSPRS